MISRTLCFAAAVFLLACAQAEPRLDWPQLFERLASEAQSPAIEGTEGWLYFTPELRHLAASEPWGGGTEADPLPAILDFKAQLDRAGIELLFVPVPAKAAIYPDFLPGVDPRAQPDAEHRVDPTDLAFFERLRAEGVAVLDLVPIFLEADRGNDGDPPLYCRQDTHWSPRGVEVAAEAIARQIATKFADVPKLELVTRKETIEITGDLWRELPEPRPPKEKLEIEAVGRATPAGFVPLETDRSSPVLLLGDSHTLVFHAGADLHATGAGLPDHLARELGFAVDLVGVRGSGATPSRINLLRRRDQLAGKRVVVWCLSVRETTEGDGWRKVPIIP